MRVLAGGRYPRKHKGRGGGVAVHAGELEALAQPRPLNGACKRAIEGSGQLCGAKRGRAGAALKCRSDGERGAGGGEVRSRCKVPLQRPLDGVGR